MALDTVLQLILNTTHTKTRDLNVPKSELDISRRVKLTNGTGAGKADRVWDDERTIAASSSEDLDLVGSLLDAFGDTFSPVRIKGLFIEANTANVNDVIVGGAAATQWAALLGTTGTLRIRPGTWVALGAGIADATGYVCAAGATDLLKVANSAAGTSVTYKIVVIGASA